MSTATKLLRDQKSLLPLNSGVPNRRILVLDDSPAIGEAIRQFLKPVPVTNVTPLRPDPEPFEVTVVRSAESAIDVLTLSLRENRPFAFGFFDVELGTEMDGIQLVRQILSVDPKMYACFVTADLARSVDQIGAMLGEENREKWTTSTSLLPPEKSCRRRAT